MLTQDLETNSPKHLVAQLLPNIFMFKEALKMWRFCGFISNTRRACTIVARYSHASIFSWLKAINMLKRILIPLQRFVLDTVRLIGLSA